MKKQFAFILSVLMLAMTLVPSAASFAAPEGNYTGFLRTYGPTGSFTNVAYFSIPCGGNTVRFYYEWNPTRYCFDLKYELDAGTVSIYQSSINYRNMNGASMTYTTPSSGNSSSVTKMIYGSSITSSQKQFDINIAMNGTIIGSVPASINATTYGRYNVSTDDYRAEIERVLTDNNYSASAYVSKTLYTEFTYQGCSDVQVSYAGSLPTPTPTVAPTTAPTTPTPAPTAPQSTYNPDTADCLLKVYGYEFEISESSPIYDAPYQTYVKSGTSYTLPDPSVYGIYPKEGYEFDYWMANGTGERAIGTQYYIPINYSSYTLIARYKRIDTTVTGTYNVKFVDENDNEVTTKPVEVSGDKDAELVIDAADFMTEAALADYKLVDENTTVTTTYGDAIDSTYTFKVALNYLDVTPVIKYVVGETVVHEVTKEAVKLLPTQTHTENIAANMNDMDMWLYKLADESVTTVTLTGDALAKANGVITVEVVENPVNFITGTENGEITINLEDQANIDSVVYAPGHYVMLDELASAPGVKSIAGVDLQPTLFSALENGEYTIAVCYNESPRPVKAANTVKAANSNSVWAPGVTSEYFISETILMIRVTVDDLPEPIVPTVSVDGNIIAVDAEAKDHVIKFGYSYGHYNTPAEMKAAGWGFNTAEKLHKATKDGDYTFYIIMDDGHEYILHATVEYYFVPTIETDGARVYATTNKEHIVKFAYVKGEYKSLEEMQAAGNIRAASVAKAFNATQSGIYTIYCRMSTGAENIITVEVNVPTIDVELTYEMTTIAPYVYASTNTEHVVKFGYAFGTHDTLASMKAAGFRMNSSEKRFIANKQGTWTIYMELDNSAIVFKTIDVAYTTEFTFTRLDANRATIAAPNGCEAAIAEVRMTAGHVTDPANVNVGIDWKTGKIVTATAGRTHTVVVEYVDGSTDLYQLTWNADSVTVVINGVSEEVPLN